VIRTRRAIEALTMGPQGTKLNLSKRQCAPRTLTSRKHTAQYGQTSEARWLQNSNLNWRIWRFNNNIKRFYHYFPPCIVFMGLLLLTKRFPPSPRLDWAFICHLRVTDPQKTRVRSRGIPRRLNKKLSMGGVNHCHLHCRLAKFRGLMRRVKYGAVIG